MVLVLADEEAREKVAQGARQVWRVLLCEKADGNLVVLRDGGKWGILATAVLLSCFLPIGISMKLDDKTDASWAVVFIPLYVSTAYVLCQVAGLVLHAWFHCRYRYREWVVDRPADNLPFFRESWRKNLTALTSWMLLNLVLNLQAWLFVLTTTGAMTRPTFSVMFVPTYLLLAVFAATLCIEISTRPNLFPVIIVALLIGCPAAFFLLFAMVLDGTVSLSYASLLIPLWAPFGLAYLFMALLPVLTGCSGYREHDWRGFNLVLVPLGWYCGPVFVIGPAIATTLLLAMSADGAISMDLVHCFIPWWCSLPAAAGGLFFWGRSFDQMVYFGS
jgi:hypothetical protein